MKKILWMLLLIAVPLHATPPKPIPTINDVAWLAGSWQGEGFGGICEEVWSAPVDNSMVGMFRMIHDGKVQFYELMTIRWETTNLMLRIKHFHPDLKGWEEKDNTVEFPLLHASPWEIGFTNVLYRKMQDGSVKVEVNTKKKTGETVTEELVYRRRD